MIKTTEVKFHIIRKSNPNFNIGSNLISIPRASISISNNCPSHVKETLTQAIKNGWVEPVAYMSDREMMVSGLLKE